MSVKQKKQEAYEGMVAWFSRPGAKLSKRESGDGDPYGTDCFYRHPRSDKIRCAIGCLIPDELYDSRMENNGVTSLFVEFNEIKNFFKGVDNDFLAEAQICHDDAVTVDDFLQELGTLAQDMGLVT